MFDVGVQWSRVKQADRQLITQVRSLWFCSETRLLLHRLDHCKYDGSNMNGSVTNGNGGDHHNGDNYFISTTSPKPPLRRNILMVGSKVFVKYTLLEFR